MQKRGLNPLIHAWTVVRACCCRMYWAPGLGNRQVRIMCHSLEGLIYKNKWMRICLKVCDVNFICYCSCGDEYWMSSSKCPSYEWLAGCSNCICRPTVGHMWQWTSDSLLLCVFVLVCAALSLSILGWHWEKSIDLTVQSACFALTCCHRFGLWVIDEALHYWVLLCYCPISCHTFTWNRTGQAGLPSLFHSRLCQSSFVWMLFLEVLCCETAQGIYLANVCRFNDALPD